MESHGKDIYLDGTACPLTRIRTTNKVPLKEPIPLKVVAQEPVVTKVYTRRPKAPKCLKHMTRDRSQLTNFVQKFLGTVKFSNDQVAKIMGYRDYQIGNVTISRFCYVEGLGHNLFFVGQVCNSDLEVAFRKHTCFVHNLEGVDLLSGSRGTNLYSLSIGVMMASALIFLLSKDTKTKSWLWHHRLSHLNFGAINHLARQGLIRGLPILKFEKDHLCSACAMGKRKKQSHKPKSEDTNQEKLYLLYMDLCGPKSVSQDEATDFIIKFLKMIQVRLNAIVRNIRTDNGTEFVNQTLLEPVLHEMTPATPNSGLVPNPTPSASFVPPLMHEWNHVFQPVFDEFLSPLASVVSPVPMVEAPAPVESTDIASLTTIDQDAPSPSTSQTNQQSQSQKLSLYAKEVSHDLEAMQEELNEIQHLKVWELVPRTDKVMINTLKCIYKVKLDEFSSIKKHDVQNDFQYLRGTVNQGLRYSKDSAITLTSFAKADHAVSQLRVERDHHEVKVNEKRKIHNITPELRMTPIKEISMIKESKGDDKSKP
ncbi:retrovirus-related pol polyprotein from transposon TNT 1-94 [Tanacetum coccineum]